MILNLTINKNYNKVFELVKKSAEGGYSGGITMLGYCYDNGIGMSMDEQKAFELSKGSKFRK